VIRCPNVNNLKFKSIGYCMAALAIVDAI